MGEETPQFGKKEPNATYTPRPGVYAIISNTKGELGVVEVKEKYFLLGGGLDNGESEEQGLRREMIEEAGKEISSLQFLGKANEYVTTADGQHINKMMSFYRVELGESTSTDSDPTHAFRWVTKDEFRARARHVAQVYAIEHL